MTRIAITSGILLGAIVLLAGQAVAQTLTCTPDDEDCWDLDHHYFYTWGIDVTSLAGMSITEVELIIDNITNWDNHPNVLFLHLLDTAPLGLERHGDNEYEFEDAFAGQGVLIDQYHDTNGAGTTEDLHYVFSDLGLIPAAQAYASDGVMAFGLDPDCHFWNDGIVLIITFECPSSAVEEISWGRLKRQFELR